MLDRATRAADPAQRNFSFERGAFFFFGYNLIDEQKAFDEKR
jgi:hypothetical protein